MVWQRRKMHPVYTITGLKAFISHFFKCCALSQQKAEMCSATQIQFRRAAMHREPKGNFTTRFVRGLHWRDTLWWVPGKPPRMYWLNTCSHWLLFIFCFHQTLNNRTKKCTLNPEGAIFSKYISAGTTTHSSLQLLERNQEKGNGAVGGAAGTEAHEDPLGKKDRDSLECVEGEKPRSLWASCASLGLRLPVWGRDIPSFARLVGGVAEEQGTGMLQYTSCQ